MDLLTVPFSIQLIDIAFDSLTSLIPSALFFDALCLPVLLLVARPNPILTSASAKELGFFVSSIEKLSA